MNSSNNTDISTYPIMGVNISVTDMPTTLSVITDNLGNWQGRYICVSNVHTTVMAYEDANYLAIQNNAVMALPDGGPLSKYCRDHGCKNSGRVTGPRLNAGNPSIERKLWVEALFLRLNSGYT